MNSQSRPFISLICSAVFLWIGFTPPGATQTLPSLPNQTPSTSSSLSDPPYTLGEGDVVRIDILNVSEYNGEYRISVGGTLVMPLIGEVSVQDLTVEQAAALITARYTKFFKRPLATLGVVIPRQLRVNITGEVNRPGAYVLQTIRGNDPQPGLQLPNLSQALRSAEGVTLTADLRQVQVRRRRRGGTVETLNLDLWQFLQNGNPELNITLRDGDSVFIPTTTTPNPADTQLLINASFAPTFTQPVSIGIVGEVVRPGVHVIDSQLGNRAEDRGRLPTVTRALQAAGGVTELADIRQVELQRQNVRGETQIITLNLLRLLQEGDTSQDLVLQVGDTLKVPTATALDPEQLQETAKASFARTSIRVSIVGEVVRPGALELPPDITVNQAILAAGGFTNERADQQAIDLIRVNPNGAISRSRIAIAAANGQESAQNLPLRNNDIIVVRRSAIAKIGDAFGTLGRPIIGIFNPVYEVFRALNTILDLQR